MDTAELESSQGHPTSPEVFRALEADCQRLQRLVAELLMKNHQLRLELQIKQHCAVGRDPD
jgi:hypothetical protein